MSDAVFARPNPQTGKYPTEPKVVAATVAAAVISFLADALSNWAQAEDHGVLLNGLPEWLEPFIAALILAIPTFVAGWQAKHQHRRQPSPSAGTP